MSGFSFFFFFKAQSLFKCNFFLLLILGSKYLAEKAHINIRIASLFSPRKTIRALIVSVFLWFYQRDPVHLLHLALEPLERQRRLKNNNKYSIFLGGKLRMCANFNRNTPGFPRSPVCTTWPPRSSCRSCWTWLRCRGRTAEGRSGTPRCRWSKKIFKIGLF